jgi:predicted component of type VI protein secretion system
MQSSDSFRLVVRRGPQPNQVYDLNKDITTIGRDITNDIAINDPEVSRHHLRFTRGAAGFTIEDLGSTNGTFVNGQRLTGARPLNPGDMIGLGETVTLQYEIARPMAAGAPSPDLMPTTAAPVSPRPPAAQPMQPQAQQPVAPVAPQSQSPAYSGGYAQQQPAAYSPAPPAPPGGGYDYDPYAVREEEPRNTTRWIIIGCVGVSVFCCCATIGGLFLIDALCLWNRIPIIGDLIRAIGWSVNCPT